MGPTPFFNYAEYYSFITYSAVFDPDRYLGDDLSCMESAAQSDFMKRDHWTFGAGCVQRVTLRVSLKSLIISLAAAVFVLEYISQKRRSGWQYLASCGAMRCALSLVNRSVMTTGKATAEERRSHSE